jgi:predicted nucleic acid-binding protein
MTYVRNNHIELREAELALDKVVGVFGSHGLYTVDLKDSLRMAARFGTSTYDARYLVLADRLGLKLVTQDKRLRGAAP